MFTTKTPPKTDAKAKKPAPAKDANAVTILTSGCHFSGKLFCRGSSRIAGRIEGQIVSEGFLVIEEQALITAEIKADEAVIQGRVQGKLTASTRVELCASSFFEGDIVTPVLVVREGAHFNGHAAMVKKEEAPASKTPRIGAQNASKAPRLPDFEGPAAKSDLGALKTPEIGVNSTP